MIRLGILSGLLEILLLKKFNLGFNESALGVVSFQRNINYLTVEEG